MSTPPEREADVLRRALALVAERLPSGWSARLADQVAPDRRVDAVVELVASDQTEALLVVKAKQSVVTRDLPVLLEQLATYEKQLERRAVPLLAARYLSPSARAWLEERGLSYVDATGNIHVVVERPALFLHDRGADHDPWRGPGRPRGTLHGPPAARVVRALVDFVPPMTVPELVKKSGASVGATYRVVEFLEREVLIDRDPRGPITTVAWRRILERWSGDYGFQRSNKVRNYLHPRGLPALLADLQGLSGLRYALTGSHAAYRLAPYAATQLAMIHVEDRNLFVEQLKLRPVDSGGNVLLAVSNYDVAFERVVEDNGLIYAAPSQAAVDLLDGPGRSPAEAQALLDWMEMHESAWRR